MRSVRWLGDQSEPAAFAHALCLVERFADLVERDCGVTEAVRLSTPWLAPWTYS